MHENQVSILIFYKMQKVKVRDVRKNIHDSAAVLKSRTFAKLQAVPCSSTNFDKLSIFTTLHPFPPTDSTKINRPGYNIRMY